MSRGDRAGFIVNALLFPYLNDVGGRSRGIPLDEVGNDVSLAIQKELFREFGEPGLEPAATLEQKVADGHLGRKTVRGFHDYGWHLAGCRHAS